MKEQFSEILLKNKKEEIIPFLKKLSGKQKKELATHLVQTGAFSTEDMPVISWIAGLYCCTLTQIRKITRWRSLNFTDADNQLIEEMLEWQCPEWYSDYFNQFSDTGFFIQDYQELLYWQSRGYQQPSPQLIAHALGAVRSPRLPDIEKYPIILEEHLWTLFENETYIDYFDSSGYRIHELTMYANEGRIQRKQLIKACLQTVNYNFKKDQIAWNMKLLAALDPTVEELALLQEELYHALNGNNPVFTSYCLQQITRLIPHLSFEADAFADTLSLLLSQTVKKTLQSTLQVMEKVVQSHPEQQERYAGEAAQLFLNKDQAIQTKATKFIVSYGDPTSAGLHTVLSDYTEYILPSVKQLLTDFLKAEVVSAESQPQEVPVPGSLLIIREETKLPPVTNFEDLLYFAIEAFSGKADFYPVMLPYYLLVFDKQLTAEQVEQLEPVYKKILQAVQQWGTDRALSDDVLICFMVSYARYLEERYPKQTERILQLVDKKIKSDLFQWRDKLKDDLFRYPVFHHLKNIFQAIREGDCYQPLSTPTHAPLWIDPQVLVQRLIRYQQEGRRPDSYDLQAAIQCCCLEDTAEACKTAQQLEGEIRLLMLFLFGEKEFEPLIAEHPVWWITTAFIRYQGNLPDVIRQTGWEIPAVFSMPLTNWKFMGPASDKTLRILDSNTLFLRGEQTNFPYLDQFYLYNRLNFDTFRGGDIYRLLLTHPYHHQHLLARFLENVTNYSDDEKGMLNILQAIHLLRQPFREMEYLAIALSFFNKYKDIAQYGAELCVETLRNKQSDPVQLGEALGKVITADWFPIKRFTTLLQHTLMSSDGELNILLIEMIESTLRHTRQTVKGLKVVLEVYKDLLIQTKRQPVPDQFPLLEEWAANSGLKKLIKELTML